ncbi:MAG: aminotransferase class III-fold pyridoxal phosphate-dependent enzyme, partial [Acutalibacteraceae bacterium]|nr:aminotransferase class III-fold pyridoxal phosphate-dependent enzyme [Acutalibacteraceae bacterium]
EYIDMGSGIGVTSFGISDPEWLNAVTQQAGKLQHTSNLYYTEPCAELAKVLCQKTGLKKVFFANSGAEANECAIKTARKWAAEQKGDDCFKILTLKNSFHGRTVTTLAATGQEHYHELFKPLTDGFVYTPANDIEQLQKAVKENNIAAVMFECIQGEGGVIPLEKDFVIEISKLAKQNNFLIIVDEVQTGNGRTGKLYAYMNYGITPDIVTTAKGLGGGLPIGAAMLGEKVESVLGFGDHGSTYGGNPVCSAGALTVINRLTDDFLDEVKQKSDYVFSALGGASGIEAVSGMGLMIGIKTVKTAAEVVKTAMQNGVLCLTAKDKVRLLPALNIPFEDLKKAIEIIKEAAAV